MKTSTRIDSEFSKEFPVKQLRLAWFMMLFFVFACSLGDKLFRSKSFQRVNSLAVCIPEGIGNDSGFVKVRV
jgi:hypothetical protein